MSEEMKMLLALIDYLNLEIRATGGNQTNVPVSEDLFNQGSQYTYAVTAKN